MSNINLQEPDEDFFRPTENVIRLDDPIQGTKIEIIGHVAVASITDADLLALDKKEHDHIYKKIYRSD